MKLPLVLVAVLALSLVACGQSTAPSATGAKEASAPSSGEGGTSYKQVVTAQSTSLADSAGRFRGLMGAPDLGTQAWDTKFRAELAIWHQSYSDAQVLRPPACLQNANAGWLSATSLFNDAASMLETSIRDKSTDERDRGFRLMAAGLDGIDVTRSRMAQAAC